MANAKKCDRCGNYYDENKTKPRELTGGYVMAKLKTLTHASATSYTDEVFDLCDECLGKFYSFMDGRELAEK